MFKKRWSTFGLLVAMLISSIVTAGLGILITIKYVVKKNAETLDFLEDDEGTYLGVSIPPKADIGQFDASTFFRTLPGTDWEHQTAFPLKKRFVHIFKKVHRGALN